MAAARAWATGTLSADQQVEHEAVLDAQRFGFDAETIAAIRAELDGGVAGAVAVWSHHVGIVRAFLALASQWRTTLEPREGGFRLLWIGLDYAAAPVAFGALDITITPRLWQGLTVMEFHARAALNGEPAA